MGLWPTDPAEQFFGRGLWGFDAAQWRKLSLLWGYTDRYFEQVVDADSAAGLVDLQATAVPAGEVRVVRAWAGIDQITDPTYISFGIYVPAVYYSFNIQNAPGVNVWANWDMEGVFKEGDRPQCRFDGCVLHDVLVFQVWGYKMAVG